MSETLERNIRFKAVIIYIIVAIICGGMALYIYKLRDNIDDQKRNIEQYNRELSFVNKLIHAVNSSQTEVNLYVFTKQLKHYNQFNDNLKTVGQLMDSLRLINPLQDGKLQQINGLLIRKGQIVSNLNKQFGNKNPIESIDEILKDIDPVIEKDTVLVTTTVQDTIIYSGSKKGFWKKLSELFSSSTGTDTVTTVTTSKLDTLTMPQRDTLHLVSEVTEMAVQAKDDYAKRIISIERNLNNLIVADQGISSEITTLLIELYNQTVENRLDEIQESERLIRNNNTYSIISSIVALVLIFIFILLIINDVNKGYILRKNIEKANARIKQIMESRHKLLLSVSHDIKTPLNSILGTLQLKGTGITKEFQPQEIHMMKNSGEHILALLNNLLELSSIEQGTSNISVRNFNLYELCRETIGIFIPLVKNKNLILSHSFDFDKNLTIASDPLKIKQILINILSNSVKYTLEGSIWFTVRYQDNKLSCEIQDTGVGMPQSQVYSMFQPFSRIEENSHLSEGSGFGLFVVKGLIDLLEGTIKVTSEVGQGTRTEISIPARQVNEINVFSPLEILVVDDDMSYLIIIRNMLLKLGHVPSSCNNMDEFEKHMPQIDRYDEVLTDMEMGHFNGINVLNKIKGSGKNVPVSIITAREDISSDYFIKAGFKAHIRKPVSIGDLRQLFGGNPSGSMADFNSLETMLGTNSEDISEVLTSFVNATAENIDILRKAVFNDNFRTAQSVCHKMLPVFIQVDATDKLHILRKMDSRRSLGTERYPEWEDDILELIEYAEQVIVQTKDYLAAR